MAHLHEQLAAAVDQWRKQGEMIFTETDTAAADRLAPLRRFTEETD